MSRLPIRRPLVVVAVVIAMIASSVAMAMAAPGSARDTQDRISRLDSQLSDAQAELAATRDRLDVLDGRLARASQALSEADERARKADVAAQLASADAKETQRRLKEARTELAANQDQLAQLARDTYKYGLQTTAPVIAAFEQLSSLDDPNALADTLHMLDVVLGDRAQIVQDSVRLLDQTTELTELARVAERQRQQDLVAAEEAREDAAAKHAEVLALVDAADAQEREQQRLVADLQGQRDEASDQLARLRAAAQVDVTPAGEGLVTVGGITVAASLAPQLEALLEAARLDGIVLGGSGYRSPETTARLRIANGCPDVYESPSSSCRVPTARPGESMHEQGLAIDFTYQGRTICYPRRPSSCRGNAAFDWLRANAGDYGLYVISTEAWHWSTNGD